MIIDSIEGINKIVNIDKIQDGFMVNTEVNGSQFSDLIGNRLDQINESIKKSENLFESFLKGESVSTHELMISMGKAKHELQLIVEIRNKLLESYQEITRIQL